MGFDRVDNEITKVQDVAASVTQRKDDNETRKGVLIFEVAKKPMIKGTKITKGNDEIPNDDDNVFVVLYKNPSTFAKRNRTIYLSRHGESLYNLHGKIGGNANLSPRGLKYSKSLARYFQDLKLSNFNVWMSQLARTHQTAYHIDAQKMIVPQLNEINSGDFDGMTYEEVAEKYPIEFAMRDQDKLKYRYPDGESYVDVCRRLCEILPMMNTSENLLVISHQAVVRCLYTFLMRTPMEELPYVKIPLHTVMKVTFDGSRNIMESVYMNIDCVDTHRAKPDNCNNNREIGDAVQTVPAHL